tara:strand:+ start:236 stop:487 length:252 start_codon:yes stop_codon:yes gene_type:complete
MWSLDSPELVRNQAYWVRIEAHSLKLVHRYDSIGAVEYVVVSSPIREGFLNSDQILHGSDPRLEKFDPAVLVVVELIPEGLLK